MVFDRDEHFRTGATLADMQKLKPVFVKENGTVTAGNASGINDATAALIMMEAGAAQACAMAKDLQLDPAKVNPNGSVISLGHPIGATGAVISVKAIHELHCIGGKYALVTMCIGGGQGIAAIFERI